MLHRTKTAGAAGTWHGGAAQVELQTQEQMMLVLTRRIEESLTIFGPNNEEIVIKLLDIESKRAKIGISAPSNMRIVRGNEKQDAKKRAEP